MLLAIKKHLLGSKSHLREVIFMLILLVAFNFRIFLGENLFFDDLMTYFYPLREWTTSLLSRGFLPLWNPYSHLGLPHMAQVQMSTFYILDLIYFLPGKIERLHSFYFFVHMFIGFLSMYWLCYKKEIKRQLSLWAGASYVFSGVIISQSTNVPYFTILVYLPMFFLLIDNIKKENTFSSKLNFIILSSFTFSIAAPHMYFIIMVFCSSYLLSDKRNFFKNLAYMILVVFIVGITNSWQFYLTIEYILAGSRYEAGLTLQEALATGLNTDDFLGLILPHFNGFQTSGVTNKILEESFLYLGSINLFLALSFNLKDLTKRINVLLLIFTLFSFGSFLTIWSPYNVIALLPLFNLFKDPSRWFVICNFIIVYSAAMSLQKIGSVKKISQIEYLRAMRKGGLVYILCILVFLLILKYEVSTLFYELILKREAVLLQILIFILSNILFILFLKKDKKSIVSYLLLGSVLVIDFGHIYWRQIPMTKVELYKQKISTTIQAIVPRILISREKINYRNMGESAVEIVNDYLQKEVGVVYGVSSLDSYTTFYNKDSLQAIESLKNIDPKLLLGVDEVVENFNGKPITLNYSRKIYTSASASNSKDPLDDYRASAHGETFWERDSEQFASQDIEVIENRENSVEIRFKNSVETLLNFNQTFSKHWHLKDSLGNNYSAIKVNGYMNAFVLNADKDLVYELYYYPSYLDFFLLLSFSTSLFLVLVWLFFKVVPYELRHKLVTYWSRMFVIFKVRF